MFGITAFAQSPFAALGGTAFAVDLAETFTSTDVYAGQAVFQGLNFESLSLSDADSGATFNFRPTVAENFSLDTVEGNVSVYDLALAEAFTTTDALVGGFVYPLSLADSLSLTDAQNVTSLFITTVAETMTVTEALTGGFFYGVTRAETATFTDATTAQYAFGPTIAETLTAIDTVPATAIYRPAILETVTLTDAPIGRGWFRVVDDQTPNWVQINNDQA
jgi:hypothetical protein